VDIAARYRGAAAESPKRTGFTTDVEEFFYPPTERAEDSIANANARDDNDRLSNGFAEKERRSSIFTDTHRECVAFADEETRMRAR